MTVLDARPRIGGRSLTVRAGDTLTDKNGVTRRAGFRTRSVLQRRTRDASAVAVSTDYCRELGVPLEVFSGATTVSRPP
ncbi:hypothetical protein [Embleya sp. NPDC005575]|uniref:hypothetical protein n=1 Tax=Embleya sp. NPDC005575 TaxID=3156892 RepID=UPI00339E554D